MCNFLLHITPRDLDLLTAEACKILSTQSMSLRENLDFVGEHVDEEDRGAYLVARPWVELWASIQPQIVDGSCCQLVFDHATGYEDLEITVSAEARQAISTFSERARQRLKRGTIWFMCGFDDCF